MIKNDLALLQRRFCYESTCAVKLFDNGEMRSIVLISCGNWIDLTCSSLNLIITSLQANVTLVYRPVAWGEAGGT